MDKKTTTRSSDKHTNYSLVTPDRLTTKELEKLTKKMSNKGLEKKKKECCTPWGRWHLNS